MGVYPKRTYFEVHQGIWNPADEEFCFEPVEAFATEKEAQAFLLERIADTLEPADLLGSHNEWRKAYKGPPLVVARMTSQTIEYVAGGTPSFAGAGQE